MKQYLLRMFRYDVWANNLMIDNAARSEINDESILSALSSIVNLQIIWYNRITYGQSEISNDNIHKLSDIILLLRQTNEKFRALLRNVDEVELDRHRSFIDEEEAAYSFSLKDILSHILNKNIYLRALISFQMIQSGVDPPNTEYINYLKEMETK